eukprot:362705-Chlamydomonas_euryale.AAC.2
MREEWQGGEGKGGGGDVWMMAGRRVIGLKKEDCLAVVVIKGPLTCFRKTIEVAMSAGGGEGRGEAKQGQTCAAQTPSADCLRRRQAGWRERTKGKGAGQKKVVGVETSVRNQ